MKKHLLILVSILVFILGVSLVAANIALPPNDPGNNPPGPPTLSDDMPEISKAYRQCLDSCHKSYRLQVEACRATLLNPRYDCLNKAYDWKRTCEKSCWREFWGPIDVFLPNGSVVQVNRTNGKLPGQGNNNQPAPNENAKANANNNAAFSTDPKPQPTCLPKGTKCTFMQSSRIYLDQIYRNMFECITPDGTTYYQYDTVFTDGRETETALTKFIGETADKCIAYYATVDPVTCRILWYSQQNRCGTVTTPVYSSP